MFSNTKYTKIIFRGVALLAILATWLLFIKIDAIFDFAEQNDFIHYNEEEK